MKLDIASYHEDFRVLVGSAAAAVGLADPVAFDPDDFETPMLKVAVRGPVTPLDGVLIRDWDRTWIKTQSGVNYGCREYRVKGIRFVRVYAQDAPDRPYLGYHFYLVDRSDYFALYRVAVRLKRTESTAPTEPVMADEHRRALWQNTVAFLEPANLKRIKEYGGRAKRGLLLTGPPGNGKTSACRWIKAEVERRGWEANTISPDDYQAARRSTCNPAEMVKGLFQASGRGVVFFDDLDIALRDRDTVKETDDQAVFLSALDGIAVNEGVVYVFTTNCSIDLIDPAFRRPGRIDVTLHFPKPNTELRRQLVNRWHAELRTAVGVERVVADTDGMTFAEIEELKNLLVLRFLDTNEWNWTWAQEQFRENRSGLTGKRGERTIGFLPSANGKH
jgi:hypothetical protein